MTQRLSAEEIQAALESVPQWSLADAQISRSFTLASFPAALIFASAVGHLAEAANHHPDMLIQWKKLTLHLTTHDADGLSEKDFALARQIDALYTGS